MLESVKILKDWIAHSDNIVFFGRALHRLHAVERAAPDAVVAQNAAMELQHIFTARLLMEAVDVLGDNRAQLPLGLPFRQLAVGAEYQRADWGGYGPAVTVYHGGDHPAREGGNAPP